MSGGGLGRTLAKQLGIGVIYATASLTAFVLTLYWVSIWG